MQASKCRCKGESLSACGLVSAAEWQCSREAENVEERKQELGIYAQDRRKRKKNKKAPKSKPALLSFCVSAGRNLGADTVIWFWLWSGFVLKQTKHKTKQLQENSSFISVKANHDLLCLANLPGGNINIVELQTISTKARSLSSLQGPAHLVALFFDFSLYN